jgi:methyl-accepting chemotaxis protein
MRTMLSGAGGLAAWSGPVLDGVLQSQAVIAFTPEGEVLYANALFCAAMRVDPGAIVGAHHRQFMPPALRESADYAAFWARLRAGQGQTATVERLRGDGRPIWLSGSYMPIHGPNGSVDLVVKIAVDVTAAEEQRRALERVTSAVQVSAAGVDTNARALLQAVERQVEASHSEAAAVAQVTSTLSELRQTSQQALEQSQGMLRAADRAHEASTHGVETVQQVIAGMAAIRQRVEVIQEKILALSDQTQQIGDIISTVNEIAEQSKLLALNASIEAARAGDSGKSFSVVAKEMRDLAEQSKQATRQVRGLLGGIREATGAAVVATEDGIAKVDDGQKLAQSSGRLMAELGEVIEQSVDAGRLIANASRQQGLGVSQVADAMVSIDHALRASAQGAEAVQRVVTELAHIAEGLQRGVDGGGARAAA